MAVKVKRERADQRRHHRVTAPLFVVHGGQRYRAADWSLGGLRIEGCREAIPEIGVEIPLHLTLPFQGFEVSFDAKAEVVRGDADAGMFAAKFTELGERERELMSHFIEELIRGSMTNIEDTIQRIDVPVTPASLEPQVNPRSQLPVRRWPAKVLVMTGLYAVLGFFVFGYAALLGYTNFYRMEIQTAVISAPVEIVTAQADGRVTWNNVKPGDSVRAGDVIVNVIDNQLEREIDLAEIAIKERKAQFAYLKRRHLDELDRMKGFANVEMKNVEQAKIDVEAMQSQLAAAEQQYGRVAILHKKGFATDAKLEEAEKQVATLKKTLESRRVELRSRVELAEFNMGRFHYTGQNMVGEIGQIEAQVRHAEHDVMLTEQKKQALAGHRDRLAVKAPFDGTILELPHVDRGAVRRGDTIAIIEQRRERQVTAYLTQDEVVKVGMNDEVLIFIPGLSETLKGRIVKIDRTSGFVREQNAAHNPGYRWRGATDRSAKVTIAFDSAERVADVEKYRSGLPVVAVFPQRTTNSTVGGLRHKLATSL
jgi:multidrug resistance efflux pump